MSWFANLIKSMYSQYNVKTNMSKMSKCILGSFEFDGSNTSIKTRLPPVFTNV